MISSSKKNAGVTAKLALAAVSLCLASTMAVAAGPNTAGGGKNYVSKSRAVGGKPTTNNTSPGTYRALVPDGSNLYQVWSGDSTKWYAFLIEPGKTYVVEAFDPYTDYDGGSVDGRGIYAGDGSSSPPETNISCGGTDVAPGLSNFAARCVVRSYVPSPGLTQNVRQVFVRVDRWPLSDTAFQIRVREATVYGRWTTNGYDFHVEVQNTTSQQVCAQVIFYPNSGLTYSGGVWSGPDLGYAYLEIPPFGANKYVVPKGTLVGTDNRGSLRVGDCGLGEALVTGGIHVNTLGFNPTINQFLPYSTTQSNNGNGGTF